MKSRSTKILAAGMVAFLSMQGAAHACPNCFASTNPHVLQTYYASAIFLSLLPLAMIAGVVGWLKKNSRQTESGPVETTQTDD